LYVRETCAVNSDVMKAARIVLSQPGLSIPKVALLIGGPDWPTSVICGMLGLKILPIMLATIPVIIVIAPNVLTGALLFMKDEKNDDGTPKNEWAQVVTALCTTFALIVTLTTGVTALYYLEFIVTTKKDEIDKIQDDEEVKAKESETNHRYQVYRDSTEWKYVPTYLKYVAVSSTVLMTVSLYILFCLTCFEEFTMTDTVEDKLDGNALNLLTTTGKIAVVIFSFACVLLCGFLNWSNKVAESAYKKEIPVLDSKKESHVI